MSFHINKSDVENLDLNLKLLEIREVTKLEEDEYYFGEWNPETKLPEGRGVSITRNKSIHMGFFKDGKPDGVGRVTYINGKVYQGQFRQGEIEGYGIFILTKEGTKMKGNWKRGKAHGE